MSSWDERTGILERWNGLVRIGFVCKCGAYDVLTMPQDDYAEVDMKKELCYTCMIRKRLASEIRYGRTVKRTAIKIIESMEKQINVLLAERQNHESLIETGAAIIAQQDAHIWELKRKRGGHRAGRKPRVDSGNASK